MLPCDNKANCSLCLRPNTATVIYLFSCFFKLIKNSSFVNGFLSLFVCCLIRFVSDDVCKCEKKIILLFVHCAYFTFFFFWFCEYLCVAFLSCGNEMQMQMTNVIIYTYVVLLLVKMAWQSQKNANAKKRSIPYCLLPLSWLWFHFLPSQSVCPINFQLAQFLCRVLLPYTPIHRNKHIFVHSRFD